MLDTERLKDLMWNCGTSNTNIAKKLGLSRQGLWLKTNGKVPFRPEEMYKLRGILHLNLTDFWDVFFAYKE